MDFHPEQKTPPLADVVIPVLNEREMLPEFLERIAALKLALNLVFVDNGSRDGTQEFLKARPDITLIEHGENLGYGRSLIDGMAAATTGQVIIIDADCEYPPEAIPGLLEALKRQPVVYASRFLGGGVSGGGGESDFGGGRGMSAAAGKRGSDIDMSLPQMRPGRRVSPAAGKSGCDIDMSRLRAGGNRLLTVFYNMLYRQRITDLYTGMKAMRREVITGMTFTRTGFEHVAELAAKIAIGGYQISELPVAYKARHTGRSKMKHLPEMMKAIYVLTYYRLIHHV